MIIFNFGLTFGLIKIGEEVGDTIPSTFEEVEHIEGSPLYSYGVGLTLTILFSFFLGVGATVAEPALNVLGLKVEQISKGNFPRFLLIFSVSIGVGLGISLGVVKVILDLPLIYFLLPLYVFAAALTLVSSEDYVCVAYDSAGVTTGPITVPLILALGVAIGNTVGSIGFGILSLASVGPIIVVLITGIITNIIKKIKQKKNRTN
eukprot:TRINITY_DN552_c0_g4_i1.p1 TRINITY_DN552_c0_g4~~TRINITY_DN552_c0_g4_i1.p1  ORF type:complete len:205 (-),score=69.78 TRINITY_DN552_c0_g4_i1:90-704(-)